MIYNFDELTFQVLSIARFKHKNGFASVNSRPYAALSFRESGVGRFEINGERIVTEPGDVLFIPADTEYKVEYSSSEKHCRSYEELQLSRGGKYLYAGADSSLRIVSGLA